MSKETKETRKDFTAINILLTYSIIVVVILLISIMSLLFKVNFEDENDNDCSDCIVTLDNSTTSTLITEPFKPRIKIKLD
jgi:competence protein ComGC